MIKILFSGLLIVSASYVLSGDPWEKVAGKHSDDWFVSSEGQRIIHQIVAYQYPSGGWPKNIDMTNPVVLEKIQMLTEAEDMSTIDNGATYSQLYFLAKAYTLTREESVKDSFLKGLDYLFKSQYPNGGWPVFYPHKGAYYGVIHFNDNSIVGVLTLLRQIEKGKPEFSWLPDAYRAKVSESLKRGTNCILDTQVQTNGLLTVWCAQHDPVTLAPAAARAFEPVSLSGMESAYITLFLMGIPDPEERIIRSVRSAVDWFYKTQIRDAALVTMPDEQGIPDRCLVREPGAGPIWARFYEIGSNRPIFTGRDGIVRYEYDQIERERRTGYMYFSDAPQRVLEKFPEWEKGIEKQP